VHPWQSVAKNTFPGFIKPRAQRKTKPLRTTQTAILDTDLHGFTRIFFFSFYILIRGNPCQKNIFTGLSIRVRNKSQTVAHPTNCWSQGIVGLRYANPTYGFSS